MRIHYLLVCSLVSLFACSSSGENVSGGIDAAVGGPGGQMFSLELPAFEVASQIEDTKCIVKRLGNEEPIRVNRIVNNIGNTSHHLILYRTSDTEEILTPFSCTPFTDTLDPSKGSLLMITQKSEDELVLPEGVALTLEANQMIRIELHYINATGAPQMAGSVSEFHTVAADEVAEEADLLFAGNPDINLSPGNNTLGPVFMTLPFELRDVNFYAITGHTHQYGTNVLVNTSDSQSGPQTPVYDVENFEWDEPETVVFDPPFKVADEGGFHLTCEYVNTSGTQVRFGESAEAEMCFFWAYYYPSRGSKVCFHTTQIGGPEGTDICCPEDPLCTLILDQL